MIDLFSLGLTHVLLLIAAWRLMGRDDLDRDPGAVADATPAPPPVRQPWGRRPGA